MVKKVSVDDDNGYCDLLIELANYDDVYDRPVPRDFYYSDYKLFKEAIVKIAKYLPTNVMPTNTYWVMQSEQPISYATLKHKVDCLKPGGHIGCYPKK